MKKSSVSYYYLGAGIVKEGLLPVENLAHAVSLHFIFYNFGRIHKSLRVTLAMEAGVSDHVWTLEEIVNLAD